MAVMATNLGFRSEQFQLFLSYKSSGCFLSSFQSNDLLVQEKKRKIDFQDCSHGSHLGFLIKTIFAIFDLQFTPMHPTKFQVNWPSGWLGE